MFYMKPSRYFPNETSARTIIENLSYVMNTMEERESPCKDGIGFLACMNDWKMKVCIRAGSNGVVLYYDAHSFSH